jgi:hypothetical protein
MDVRGTADQIRELGGGDFDDAETLHRSLTDLHELVAAVQGTYQRIGDKLEDTPQTGYADAVKEAASALGGIAEELQGKVGGGVLRR